MFAGLRCGKTKDLPTRSQKNIIIDRETQKCFNNRYFTVFRNISESLKVICITLSRLNLTWEQRELKRRKEKVVFVLQILQSEKH
jgi:hypothetical protein